MFELEFHPCEVCRAMVSGPHACSPYALGKVRFESELRPTSQLTEGDVRRIVREELVRSGMLMVGER